MTSLYRTALILLALFSAAGAAAAGWRGGLSVFVGGLLSLLNARWMASGIDLVTGKEGHRHVSAVMVRFVGRLVLILGVLFAIIQTSFLSLLGFIAGFSVAMLAALIEEFRRIVWKSR